MGTDYGNAFFEEIREGCRRSAETVVPLFLGHYEPLTVVDVGCGEGWWGKAFQDAGCSVIGLDNGDVAPVIALERQDLSVELQPTARFHPKTARFDLAVCLEVAEHLPPERADSFVSDLCQLAPVVLFSAAIPGQGGHGHLNEQWPSYWVERFEASGYECTGALRWAIWEDEGVENWYRQNLMVAVRSWELVPTLFADSAGTREMLPIVHPVLYEARRS